ncbi:tyrosine-type recombinase/integrase [bacterium]|nr:tyrosine-type recombinase/integrase [bacterium]
MGTVDFAAAVARWRSEPVVVPYRKRLADGTEGKRWIRRLPPNSPTTINTRLRVAQGIWSWGTDVQGLALPRILWKRLRLEEPDRDPLALHVPPALREAVMAAAAPHVRIALLIAEETGLRIGSVLALRWERIDLEAARYSITVKSRRPGGRVVVKPITPALRAILEEAAGLDHDEKRDGPQRPTRKEIGAVVSYNGVAVRSIKKGVQAARRRAGLPSFLAKNLRHSTAIEILAAGGTITDAQAALDHTDPGVTHKHYGRLDVDRVRQAMERRTLAAKKRG